MKSLEEISKELADLFIKEQDYPTNKIKEVLKDSEFQNMEHTIKTVVYNELYNKYARLIKYSRTKPYKEGILFILGLSLFWINEYVGTGLIFFAISLALSRPFLYFDVKSAMTEDIKRKLENLKPKNKQIVKH